MPTVLRSGPYRFFFYAGDRDEPQHVHVERDDRIAKFWLDPIRLQGSGGFSRVEIARIEKLVSNHRIELTERGMGTSAVELEIPFAEDVTVSDDTLSVDLSDGRSISVPLAWYPRLLHASSAERKRWRLIGRGLGIHWDDLDEDISIEGLLTGKPSGESQASFSRWLAKRSSRPTTRSTRTREKAPRAG